MGTPLRDVRRVVGGGWVFALCVSAVAGLAIADERISGIDRITAGRVNASPQLITVPSNYSFDHAFLPVVSGDGRFVAYTARVDGVWQLFVRDRKNETPTGTALLSIRLPTGQPAIADSNSPVLSPNGRFIAFASNDSGLVTENSGPHNIYVHDRDADTDGVFDETTSGSRKNVRVSVRWPFNVPANAACFSPSISDDGRFVAFSSSANTLILGDTNGAPPNGSDVFVHDRDFDTDGVFDESQATARRTLRVSVSSAGTESNFNSASTSPSMSGDGRFVAFESTASNLVQNDSNGFADVFLHDRDVDANGIFDEAGRIATTRVSLALGGGEANGPSGRPAISANGRFIAYVSIANNAVARDQRGVSDVFVHDHSTGATQRVSVGINGTEADGNSFNPSISGDGRFVGFESQASNLVPGDTNGCVDSFVFDRLVVDPISAIRRVSLAVGGLEIASGGGQSFLAANGVSVAFTTSAVLLVGADSDSYRDVYALDIEP